MNTHDVLPWLESRRDVTSLRAAVFDINGMMRGKRVPVAQAEKVLSGRLRMPLSAVCVDIWGRDDQLSPLVYAEGDADGFARPTGRALVMNWLEPPSLLLPVAMWSEDGAPFGVDPRQALAAVCGRFEARGLKPVVATELEFSLVDAGGEVPQRPVSPQTGRRLGSEGVLCLGQLDAFEGFFSDVFAACAQCGVPADSAISEGGSGQFEINLTHVDDPLRAADDAVLFKAIVKGIARRHGLAASFMAKPFADQAGNGFHVHFSLLDGDRRNVFDDGGQAGTDVLRHAVGGILALMRDAALVFAPHQNSYRRLRPMSHAPTQVCWGYESRHVAVRIPGGDAKARRIEHRVAGADANPYLVLAAILGSALDGIERQVAPPAPRSGPVEGQGPERLPEDWHHALALFEASEGLAGIFGPDLMARFAGVKRQEIDEFAKRISRFEYETYLETV